MPQEHKLLRKRSQFFFCGACISCLRLDAIPRSGARRHLQYEGSARTVPFTVDIPRHSMIFHAIPQEETRELGGLNSQNRTPKKRAFSQTQRCDSLAPLSPPVAPHVVPLFRADCPQLPVSRFCGRRGTSRAFHRFFRRRAVQVRVAAL